MSEPTVNTTLDGHVAVVEFARPPKNFFNTQLIDMLAATLEDLATDGTCRAVVLCSPGRHFCPGANLDEGTTSGDVEPAGSMRLYDAAVRLFEQPLPVVAAVQGAAIGGGLGLAMARDFRVATYASRFSAPFARLGFHHGFGLSVTLPLVVGHQHTLDLLYTARRVGGEEAARMGLCDQVVDEGELRAAALQRAHEIATSAPLAVRAIRATMRGHLAAQVRKATGYEKAEQDRLKATADFAEGVRADLERRSARFEGR